MLPMPQSVAGWLDGLGPALGLALLWAAAALAPGRWANWRARSRSRTVATRPTTAPPGLLATLAPATLPAALALAAVGWVVADVVAARAWGGGTATALGWRAPVDRLGAGLAMAAAWAAARPWDRRAAAPLAGGVAAVTAAALWLGAAPPGAGGAAVLDRAVLVDVALAAVALVLAGAAARPPGPRSPGVVPVLGVLAFGSACQSLWPAAGPALWWRAGLVAAGAVAAAATLPPAARAAGMRTALRAAAWLGTPRLRALLEVASAWRRTASAASPVGSTAPVDRHARSFVERAAGLADGLAGLAAGVGAAGAARVAAAAGGLRRALAALADVGRRIGPALRPRRGDRPRPADSARARLALAGALADGLHGVLTQLDAAVVFAGLIEGDQVQFWALTPSGALHELYRRPLEQLPALRRTLLSGAAAFGGRTEARDIDDLYQHLGLPYDGPALAAAGGRPARLVLLAGSGFGPWRRDDPALLAAAASGLAGRLAEIAAPAVVPAPAPAVAAEDVAQLQSALAALHVEVAQLAARLDGVERRLDGPPATVAAGTAGLTPSPAASYLARLETFQRLFEPLPWGIVVADTEGRVVLANTASRRLLVGAALLPGHRVDLPGPGARTLVTALRDPASALRGTRVALAALDTVVRVEPIEWPGEHHRRRLGATLVVATTADAAARGEADLVDLLEALRDPLVDLRIQGETLEAEVRMPAPDLLRHLTVLDGHVAGLRAVLGALAARRSLALRRHVADIGALDVGQLGATTELSLRDLFALRGIRFRGIRGSVPPGLTLDVRLLEQVALAMVAGVATTASWGSHLSVQLRHEVVPGAGGAPRDTVLVEVDLLDGGRTAIRQRAALDAAALAAQPAALRVSQSLASAGFPGCEAWFSRRQPNDQRLQLCLRVPVPTAA